MSFKYAYAFKKSCEKHVLLKKNMYFSRIKGHMSFLKVSYKLVCTKFMSL
jgi:hypothetical protein